MATRHDHLLRDDAPVFPELNNSARVIGQQAGNGELPTQVVVDRRFFAIWVPNKVAFTNGSSYEKRVIGRSADHMVALDVRS